MPIIRAENVSKCYQLQRGGRENYVALRDVITGAAKSLFGGKSNKQKSFEDFWALKDVSFEVKEGEAVGIIGRNGAGKSTLLKVLSRITEPTRGSIRLRGRVASLLEVGTGFHPELTGRENIFLNGAILGMSKTEIRSKFDAIVEFAGIEKFLETPVKRYSSGMYVRLAFAVAAHLEPEILIIDEVLAVGDAEFQKRCLGKMSEVAKSGRTVLFVSHNLQAVTSLCQSGIVLQHGQVQTHCSAQEAVRYYLRNNSTQADFSYTRTDAPKHPHIRSAVLTQAGGNTGSFEMHEPMALTCEIDLADKSSATLTVVVRNSSGSWLHHCSDEFSPSPEEQSASTIRRCTMPAYAFGADEYTLTFALGSRTTGELFEKIEDAVRFEVSFTGPMSDRSSSSAWRGATGPGIFKWSC